MFHGRKTLTFRVDFGAKLDSQIQDTAFSIPALFRREGDRIPVRG